MIMNTNTQMHMRLSRQGLQAVNIDPPHFSGQSFHIGAATTAAQAGIEDSVVKMLGRWESAAYHRYI